MRRLIATTKEEMSVVKIRGIKAGHLDSSLHFKPKKGENPMLVASENG